MSPACRAEGSISIELLIAFAVFTLTASAVILTEAGAADSAESAARHTDMIAAIDSAVANALGALRQDFLHPDSATSTYEIHESQYLVGTSYTFLTPCLKEAHVAASYGRTRIERMLRIAKTDESLSVGGDCPYAPIPGGWSSAASEPYSRPGEKGSAVDFLNGTAYLGTDAPPYLAILRDGSYGSTSADFALYAKPNALDAALVRSGAETHTYLFAALATSSKQFAIITIDDPSHPVLVASSTLAGVDPHGFKPEGWRLYFYDDRVYISTLETAGPELHIFDVSNPLHPVEKGSGVSLNSTLTDFVVRREGERTLLYASGARDSAEISVYDVTSAGQATEVASLRQDLPGSQDGESIFLIGNRLYLGRASNTAGPEFYAYAIDSGASALTLLGTAEIPSVSLSAIRVSGTYAYLAATPTGISTRRVDVWDVSDPASMKRVLGYSLQGLAPHGIDYGEDGIYAASERDPVLRLLTSN